MNSNGASEEQKNKSQILYDKIMTKAEEMGIANEVDKYMKMHLDSMLKGDPKLGFGRTDMKEQIELGENAKSAFDKIIKSGGIDKKDFEKAKNLYVKKDLEGLKKHIRTLDTAPLEAVMDVISQNDDKAFMKMYPKSKKGQSMVQIAMFPYNLDLKQFKKQVSEGKMGDYALVGKKDDKVVDVGRLKDMRNQRVKMGRNKYDVYPARGSTPGDTFVTTACPPVNEENTMNQDLIDAVAKIMGEAKEKTPRQLVDPKKEVMVVKKNKVIVIDKKDKEKYTKFFNAALKKFGVDSPADFKDEKKKKEFFNYVDKNYVGDHEEQMKKEEADLDSYIAAIAIEEALEDGVDIEDDEDFNEWLDEKKMTSKAKAAAKKYRMSAAGKKSIAKSKKKRSKPGYKVDKKRAAKMKKARMKNSYDPELDENYEIGKDYGKHTREVTPGQSNDDFNKMVDVMQKKNTSMREALAKVWGMDEGKSPFKKEEKPMGKTMTGKPETKVKVDPDLEEKKK
jgi:hypothetical protein